MRNIESLRKSYYLQYIGQFSKVVVAHGSQNTFLNQVSTNKKDDFCQQVAEKRGSIDLNSLRLGKPRNNLITKINKYEQGINKMNAEERVPKYSFINPLYRLAKRQKKQFSTESKLVLKSKLINIS